jgi:hypothetical protein
VAVSVGALHVLLVSSAFERQRIPSLIRQPPDLSCILSVFVTFV